MQGHRPCILHLIFIPPSRSWRDFSAYLHPVLLPRSRNIRAAAAAPLPDFRQSTRRFTAHTRQNPLSLQSHIFHKLSDPADMHHGSGVTYIFLVLPLIP